MSSLPEPPQGKRKRICIVSEGSYPFIIGGVSAWVQDLIQGLQDFDFVLYTFSPRPDQELRYKLPSNVVEHVDIDLSGLQPKSPPAKAAQISQQAIHSISENHEPDRLNTWQLMQMIQAIPEGYELGKREISHDKLWDILVQGNFRNNPIYPFSDYYWAWKSCHELLFRVLAAKAPQADLYHSISTGFAGLAALAAKVRHSKPFLLTEHGLYHKEREIEIRKANFVRGYQRDMWSKLYRSLSRFCYKSADAITALFEHNRQIQIQEGAQPERCRVIPNGIKLERFESIPRQAHEGFNVGLVGRMVPIKDIKTYIMACRILLQAMPDCTCYAIGPQEEDPEYYEECVMLVQSLGIQDRFVFTGRVQVTEWYGKLDVMLLTSVREAQPLVIMEAWMAGVPVVSTTVGNVPEMLDFNDNFLSPPKTPTKLAQGVFYIRENPDATAKALHAWREKTRRYYNQPLLLDTYRDLYGGF